MPTVPPPSHHYGIDFGTTNTRIALYHKGTVRLVPFRTVAGIAFDQWPTRLAYRHGRAVAFGVDALAGPPRELFAEKLKWMLGGESPDASLPGEGVRGRIEVVADYLRHLREQVSGQEGLPELNRAAVTIPVHYPHRARAELQEAFAAAGIEITRFFFEPIAAIYAGLVGAPLAGIAAVFDWGGGSLDIAAVQVRGGFAYTRRIEGWHRGGTDFDDLIAESAVNDFLTVHRGHPAAERVTTEQVLTAWPNRTAVRERCRVAKERLRTADATLVEVADFLAELALIFPLDRATFRSMIAADLVGGFARLERSLHACNTTPGTVARLFLSGGTCHLAPIREHLTRTYGGRLADRLELPTALTGRNPAPGLADIGNATAIGAALMAADGADAVFSNAIGVRTTGGPRGGAQFETVFPAREPLAFDEPRNVSFFVTDASAGVARLLVCEQEDEAVEPGGRLMRILAVPIRPGESWVDVQFTVDRHLTLHVVAAGRMDRRPPPRRFEGRWTAECRVQQLNLGFRLPVGGAA